MRRVTMIVSMSGGGPGGRDWRDHPAGSMLDVEDAEAEDLIRIGLAVPAPEEGDTGDSAAPAPPAEAPVPAEPAAPDTGVSAVTQVSPLAETAVTSAGTVPEAPAEPAVAPEPPQPSDIKQRWIDYAISRGEDPAIAANMTKADLMSKYGGRL